MDYNPRRPFYLTLGALAVAGLGYGGYVWWQMQPRYSAAPVQTQARPVAAPAQSAAASAPVGRAFRTRRACSARASAAGSRAIAARTGVPGIPPYSRCVRRERDPSPPRNACLRAFGAAVRTLFEPERIRFAAGGRSARAIAINAPTLSVDPLVEQAYQAFQRNDLAAARESYQRALAREPTNRDALLGLAAIDVRNGQLRLGRGALPQTARNRSARQHAVASLITLRGAARPGGFGEPLENPDRNPAGVRASAFLARQPVCAAVALDEAQSAYFKAYSVDPENADYASISRQPRSACTRGNSRSSITSERLL